MERMDTSNPGKDSYLEAAIHIARYASVASMVQGRRVLDLACGEGFGSHFLAEFEPSSVLGVDISEDAIASAKKTFKHELVRYLVADANEIVSVLKDQGKFDLICSFETFEHIEKPEVYLSGLKDLISDHGVIAISCPNDNWYYPESETSNPFHIRKYTFNEFKSIAEAVLGRATFWMSGTAAIGFQNQQVFPYQESPSLGSSWLQVARSNAFDVRSSHDVPVQDLVPGYWIGFWGEASSETSGAQASISLEMLNQFYESYAAWKGRVPSVGFLEEKLERTELRLQLLEEQNRLLREKNLRVGEDDLFVPERKQLALKLMEKITPIAKKFIPTSLHERVYRAVNKIIG